VSRNEFPATVQQLRQRLDELQIPDAPTRPAQGRLTVKNPACAAAYLCDQFFGGNDCNFDGTELATFEGTRYESKKKTKTMVTRKDLEKIVANVLSRIELVEGCSK
jgi:hypothetical protein